MPSFPEVMSAFKAGMLFLGIANVFIALLFLVWPDAFSWINTRLSMWVPTEKIEAALSRKRDVDPYILKVRRFLGFMSGALAIFLLFLYFKM